MREGRTKDCPDLLRPGQLRSADKHCVAEGEESVLFCDSFLVGGQDIFAACQRGDQHKKRGLREVEICDKGVCNLEAVTGVDKDIAKSEAKRS